jgi:hypothetical protein
MDCSSNGQPPHEGERALSERIQQAIIAKEGLVDAKKKNGSNR